MAKLTSTNLTSTIVKNAISAANNVWSNLMTYVSTTANIGINKWSKYKPVQGVWPQADTGYYGFYMNAGSPSDKWDYYTPTSDYRLGDFRGYEHVRTLAYPTIVCWDTDNNSSSFNDASYATIWPTATPYTNRWYVRAQHTDSNDCLVLPSAISYGGTTLNNYYYGIKVDNGSTWYKTFGLVSSMSWSATANIAPSLELTSRTSPAFSSFPYGLGTCTWQLFISSSSHAAWTGTVPTNIIYFPGIAKGGTADNWDTDGTNKYITSGSFTIHNWLALADTNPFTASFSWDSGSHSGDTVVNCSYSAGPPNFTYSVTTGGSWLTADLYSSLGVHKADGLADDGDIVRVSANAVPNYSSVTCVSNEPGGSSYEWTNLDNGTSHAHPTLARSPDGVVTVTSDTETKTITVSQGTAGTDQLSFQFKPDDAGTDPFPPGSTEVDVEIKNAGGTTVYGPTSGAGLFYGRANVMSSLYTVTISETCQNDAYTVYIHIHI